LGLSLAKLHLAANDVSAAATALAFASQMKQFRTDEWPMGREAAGLLAAHGARLAALQVYTALVRAKAPTPEALKAVLGEAQATADAAGDRALSQEFAHQLDELSGARIPAKP